LAIAASVVLDNPRYAPIFERLEEELAAACRAASVEQRAAGFLDSVRPALALLADPTGIDVSKYSKFEMDQPAMAISLHSDFPRQARSRAASKNCSALSSRGRLDDC
jgi:hypothetical protein